MPTSGECFTLILNGLTFVKLFESLRCGSVHKFKVLLYCWINRLFSRPVLLCSQYVKDDKIWGLTHQFNSDNI